MLGKLVILFLGTILLGACGIDTQDTTEPPRTATSSPLETPPPVPTITATPRPIIPTTTPVATPEPAPAQDADPVAPPAGTTGLSGSTSGVQLDEACLETAGHDGAIADSEVRLPGASPALLEPVQPYTPLPFVQDVALQQALDDVLGGDEERYAFFVKDLATGAGAYHNPDRLFNAASLFKLFVMYEVFHQQDLGLFDWDTELVITPYYDAFALSPRITELCQVITVADALQAMLSVSDNAAAVLLQDLVGAGNINNAITTLGLVESGLFTDGLPITAVDLALLLEAIGRGEAVSAEASADMLKLMSQERIDNGLVRGLLGNAVVAHKTGNWSDATHDAGIVFTDRGAYVFVALSETAYETSIITALSSAAYAHFTGE